MPVDAQSLSATLATRSLAYEAKLKRTGFLAAEIAADNKEAIAAALSSFVKSYGLAQAGFVDTGLLDKALDHAIVAKSAPQALQGRLLMDYGEAGAGVRLQVRARDFGGNSRLLGQPKATSESGLFSLSVEPTPGTTFEIVPIAADGKVGLALSAALSSPKDIGPLLLVAPAALRPPTSEFDRLNLAVTAQLGANADLALAREDGSGRGDISNLATSTGWDARALALAAGAKQFAKASGWSYKVSYALARSGTALDLRSLGSLDGTHIAATLKAAREQSIVALDDAEITTAVQRHAVLVKQQFTARPMNAAGLKLGEVIRQALNDDSQVANFENALLEYATKAPLDRSLWDIARSKNVSEASIRRLEWQGQLAGLTRANSGLIGSLLGELDSAKPLSQIANEKGLTTAAAWKEKLNQIAAGNAGRLEQLLPPVEGPVDPATRLARYAEDLAAQVRLAFPTESVIHDIGKLGPAASGLNPVDHAALLGVLGEQAAAGYRIGESGMSRITDLLPAKPDLRAAAARLHRLYQVTPDNESLELLWSEPDFDSAFSIASLTKLDWLDHFKLKSPLRFPDIRRRLEAVHARAEQVVEFTQNFYSMVRTTASTPSTPVLRGLAGAPPSAELQQRFPTLAGMVGELPECEHCRSVLSPAAYFVDLLRLLDRPEPDWNVFLDRYKLDHQRAYPHPTPFEVLDRRRPDLATLALTCANTHTALPYIDIVNEILEGVVDPPAQALHDVNAEQEDFSPEELIAEPRRTRVAAYQTLVESRYPLQLPFDLPTEQARAWQPLLGLEPGELQETWTPAESYAAALERLGISAARARLFDDAAQLGQWHTWYGLQSNATSQLPDAGRLASSLGLTPEELLQAVRSRFVNPNLESLAILQKLGLALSDVVRSKSGQPPFTAAERELYDARLVALDTAGFRAGETLDGLWNDGSLPGALVLAETVPGGPFDTVRVRRCDGSPPQPLALLRLNQWVRLLRHIGWTATEADAQLCALYPGGLKALKSGVQWPERTRAMLVLLDRARQLQDLLKIGASSDFFIPALWADIPTTGSDPLYARLFLRGLEPGPFDHPAGRYLSDATVKLYAHLPLVASRLGVDEAAIRTLFPQDRVLDLACLSTIYRHARLAKALGLDLPALLGWKRVVAIDPCEPPESSVQGALDRSARTLSFVRFVLRARRRNLPWQRADSWVSGTFAPPAEWVPERILVDLRSEAAQAERAVPAGRPLAEALQAQLSTRFGLEGLWSRLLLDGATSLSLGPTRKGLATIVAPALAEPAEPAAIVLADAALLEFAEALDLARGLQMQPAELRLLHNSRGFFKSEHGWLGGMLEYAEERDQTAGGANAWPALVVAAMSSALEPAAKATEIVAAALTALLPGISESQVSELVVVLWPQSADRAANLASWPGVQRLVTCLRQQLHTRQPAATLLKWTRLADLTAPYRLRMELAAQQHDAARARFRPAAWLTAVRAASDELRRKRRDALLASVTEARNLPGAEAVYEHYLIDPAMEPAVLTSRLRIAIATVQLFIHRSLLSLEREVLPGAIRGDQWQWMKRYRVWEANRKIFLYPENWLEPEFRDDRSHLFRRLEERLLQSEIDNPAAEEAFFEYARDLEGIANLDIVAITCEQPAGDLAGNTLHVIGRTHAAPRKYFHRRFALASWTPWEPLDAEIQGDHIVAAFWKHRLHVFWLNFSDGADEQQAPSKVSAGTAVELKKPQRKRSVSLAWADCVRGEWQTHNAQGATMEFELTAAQASGAASNPLFVRTVIVRAASEDRELYVVVERVHEGRNAQGRSFKVISHNAPVTIVDHLYRQITRPIKLTPGIVLDMPDLEAIPPTGLVARWPSGLEEKPLARAVNRYFAKSGDLTTSFYQLETERTETGSNPPAADPNAKPDKGPQRMLKVAAEGMQVTLLNEPLRLDEPLWAKRLAPFFFADHSGSYYVEPQRKSWVRTVKEEWWGIDWRDYVRVIERPPLSPLFPPIPPKGDPIPILDLPESGFGPLRPFEPAGPIGPETLPPVRDWLLDPGTVIRFGETDIGYQLAAVRTNIG